VRLGTKTSSTNASALQELQLTREILEQTEDHSMGRTMNIAYFDTPDGDPVVGFTYSCDFRAEEEWGIGDLVKALTGDNPRSFHMTKKAEQYVAFFSDVNGLILSTEPLPKREYSWGEPVGQPAWTQGENDYYTDYARHFEQTLPYAQGIDDHVRSWMSVKELREVGTRFGLEKLPRKKAELYAVVAAVVREQGEPKYPDVWPAWFYNGKQLILRADTGLGARVLARVAKAARAGQLGVGSGSSNPFSRGLLFFDARDETKGLRQAIKERHDWHDAQMKKVAPAEAELKRLGYCWYALGNPRELDSGDGKQKLRFWVNGLRLQDYYQLRRAGGTILVDEEEKAAMSQARDLAGWFTVDELVERDLRLGRIQERIEERARYSRAA
jgi:hypothetical protein